MNEHIIVKKGGFLNKYRTIQQGINAANDGGIVYIEEGTYKESLRIEEKNITLIGQGEVIVTGENNHPILTIIDTTSTLQALSFIQKGHSNTVYVRENATLQIEGCTIEGEDINDVKTTYPALWIGLDSSVKVSDSTLIAHTSNSLHIQEATVNLQNCTIKGFGIYIYQQGQLTTQNMKISHPSSYGIFVKEGKIDLQETKVIGGGVALIMENSTGIINAIETNHTYRDVFRVDHSDLTIENGDIQHFCEINPEEEKNNYPALFIKNNSNVVLKNLNIHDSRLDGIQVYQSKLEIYDTEIAKVYMGIFIRQQAKVLLENVRISKTAFNALSAAGNTDIVIKNTQFDECVVTKYEKIYPVIIIREHGSLHISDTTIKNSANDALYMSEVQNAALENIIVDGTDVGIYSEKTPLKAANLTIKNCSKNAAFFVESDVTLANSTIENNNITSSPEYELDSDIPRKVDAAISVTHAQVNATNLTINDKTASISMQNNSRFQSDSIRLSGGVFSLESDFRARHLSFSNLEKEPVHFKLLVNSFASIEFDNPNDSISYVKDLNSQLESNLLRPAHTIVQHDFGNGAKNPPLTPVNQQLSENNQKSLQENQAEEGAQPKIKLTGPAAYKSAMNHLLKQASLYHFRLSQGITLPSNWSMIWTIKDNESLENLIKQTTQAFFEAKLIAENHYTKFSETDFSITIDKPIDLLWIDKMDRFFENETISNELLQKIDQVPMIFSGTETEVQILKTHSPELFTKISYQLTIDNFSAEETAEIIQQKLTDLQFIFDTPFLKQTIIENYPYSAENLATWPETVVQSIIKSQSERLLAESNQQLSKDQVITLTQADIFKGIWATIK